MASIFITGSADGLGKLTAQLLVRQGHQVVLHARNAERGREALKKTPRAEHVVTGDLSDLAETKALADQVNRLGTFDAVIHNAGVYQTSSAQIFAVNTLAPYVLTCLINKPRRLIYLSSGMHLSGQPKLEYFNTNVDRINYSDSKLHVVMLALIVARRWPEVYSNAVDPGWVPTKMGGRNAPDNLEKGIETQAWLATSNDEKARVSGRYFFHQKERACNPIATGVVLQESLLKALQDLTGTAFPG